MVFFLFELCGPTERERRKCSWFRWMNSFGSCLASSNLYNFRQFAFTSANAIRVFIAGNKRLREYSLDHKYKNEITAESASGSNSNERLPQQLKTNRIGLFFSIENRLRGECVQTSIGIRPKTARERESKCEKNSAWDVFISYSTNYILFSLRPALARLKCVSHWMSSFNRFCLRSKVTQSRAEYSPVTHKVIPIKWLGMRSESSSSSSSSSVIRFLPINFNELLSSICRVIEVYVSSCIRICLVRSEWSACVADRDRDLFALNENHNEFT